MRNKIIIFDFDGTIADGLYCVIGVFRSISGKYGLKKMSTAEMEKLIKTTSSAEFFKELNLSFWKAPFAIRAARKELSRQMDKIKIFSEIENVLAKLKKRGHILCILTSNSQENIDYFLKKNNLTVFDFAYGGCGLFGKSRFMKKILKKYNCNTSEAVSIGDETRDIEAAKKCNITSVAVSWGFNSRNILEKYQPDYLIDNPEDLLEIL